MFCFLKFTLDLCKEISKRKSRTIVLSRCCDDIKITIFKPNHVLFNMNTPTTTVSRSLEHSLNFFHNFLWCRINHFFSP